MERTDHAVVVDGSADRDVGAEVRAVRVEHVWGAGVAAVADQPPAEVVKPDHIAPIDLPAVGDLKPAFGVGGERESLVTEPRGDDILSKPSVTEPPPVR